MFTLENLKKLREETGLSISLCKTALEEADNDINKAKERLKQYGEKFYEKKKERITKIGAIFSYLHHNQKIAVLIELLCETDFVAKNSEFQKLGNDLAKQIASMNPKDVKELYSQTFIKDSSRTIDSLIKEYILKLGENIKVGKFIRFEL